MSELFDLYCKNNNITKKTKPILIIGNGKSASKIDWEWLKIANIDTFGMNSAYKMYSKLDFYPTYYANLDDVVIISHKKNLQKLLDEKKINKYYYLKWCSWIKYPRESYNFQENERYYGVVKTGLNKLSATHNNFHSWGNTGSDCVQLAIMLGYSEIYIIGIDGYVEKITQAKELVVNRRKTLVMDETPKDNPNYWFAEYQEKGEEFNFPNEKTAHVPGWNFSKMVCDKLNIKYNNLSNPEYIKSIPHMDYKDFVNKIN